MKRTGAIVAGLLCAAFIATSLLLEFMPFDISRWQACNHFAPDKMAAICIVIMLLVAWTVSVQLRVSDRAIRHYLLVMSVLLGTWLLVLLLKRVTTNADVERICWYLFYPPMIGSALALFGCGMRTGFPGARPSANARRRRIVMDTALAVSCALALVMLTNDLHHLAFSFDLASPRWSNEYAYGIAYYLAAAWIALLFAGFVATLAIGLRRQERRQLIPLLFVLLAGSAYCLCYFLRVPMFFTSNFTVFYCTLMMLFVELCLDFRLLPSCAWYGTVFKKAARGSHVLSSQLVSEYASDDAGPLPASVTRRIAEQARQGNVAFRIEVAERPDEVFDVFPVRGGWAVVAEDVAEVHRLHAQLLERTEQLGRSMALLEQDLEVRRQLYRQHAEESLLSEVDASISGAVVHIRDILGSLPPGDTCEGLEARRRSLMLVKLLVAYCKRKGNLVLIEQEGGWVDRNRLELMYDETDSDLATVGVESGALIEVERLSATMTSLLYDCFYDLILVAFDCTGPVIMSYVKDSPDGGVEMHIAFQCEDGTDFSHASAATALAESLARRGVCYRIAGDTGMLALHIDAGGASHA